MATLSTSPISALWVSWTDMDKLVDVETYGLPQITKWTKAQVKSQFASKDLSPMCCPHLRAPRIPDAIVEINNSRNNNAAMQYYMANNRFWLAHRMLLQAQFQSAVRFTTDECYYLLEEGEAVVEVNGRPLTGAEKRMLDVEPGQVDMSELQPTEMKMYLGVAMRIPPYTVHCFKVKEDSLVTAGCIVPRGREE
ncbi:hypothetical protein J4E83_007991 [Alternaria metachromatica]|uniref:uncharacterized protein n=1 Tax=Alternaria metachromatica TaxID=283354 RepID=UPI0020C22AB4|nr:uncharacterized protein J4E83_007991 [Alternaria metachromatica]KAI4611740.1 hypothetical protein J4E83_007991 [Alternaria metachromatica]